MHHDLTGQRSRLAGETNIDSIRALDKEICRQEEVTIKLKRTRNSLLNVNTLPLEVLCEIFRWNIIPESDFGVLRDRSHNFLLVCHHWFEVASGIPDLWSFWGNTPKDWARWHPHSKTAPLDLVLNAPSYNDEYLDEVLVGVLRDRASRNLIRLVHLNSKNQTILKSVLASLTLEDGEVQSNRMESLILCNSSLALPIDVSNFFAGYRFPRLKRLEFDSIISSWGYLISRTGALTDLSLNFWQPSPNPTISQFLSILKSNPLLQKIKISWGRVFNGSRGGDGDDDISSSRVKLDHLKRLELAGNLRHILRLLDRLDHPVISDVLAITLYGCTVTEISQTIEPYFLKHRQTRDRPQGVLGLHILNDYEKVELSVGSVARMDPGLVQMENILALTVHLDRASPTRMEADAILKLIAHLPREEFVYFQALDKTDAMGNLYASFPNLETLHLVGHLPALFPKHDSGGDEGILPVLKNLSLESLTMNKDGWRPLTTFLAGRKSSGKRLGTLRIFNSGHMCSEVKESVKGAVQDFDTADLDRSDRCWFCTC